MRPASGVLAEINRWVLFYPILAAEFVDPPRSINQFLLAGVEGVTGRAHVNMQVLGQGRARTEGIAATAGNGDLLVLGMDFGFHHMDLLYKRVRQRWRTGAILALEGSLNQAVLAAQPWY